MKTHTPFVLAAAAAALLPAMPAEAQAPANAFVGEIMLLGNQQCPTTTVDANGGLLSVAQNQGLFALFGNTYGGNGQTTFAVPDLRGRAILHAGQGPGLAPYQLGQAGGAESIALAPDNLAPHAHTGNLRALETAGNSNNPASAVLGDFPGPNPTYVRGDGLAPTLDMKLGAIESEVTGGLEPFPTRNPFLAMRYCVVTNGTYPPR